MCRACNGRPFRGDVPPLRLRRPNRDLPAGPSSGPEPSERSRGRRGGAGAGLHLDGDAPVRARDRQVQQISRKYAVVPLPAPVSWAIDRVGLVADVTVALVSVQVPLPAVLLARPVVENTHVEECVSTAVMESRLQAVVDSWLMSAASAGVALVQAAGVGQLAVPAVPGTKPVQFVPPTIVTR